MPQDYRFPSRPGEVLMAAPSEGTITDQALDDAVNRKRDQLISKIGSCIPQLIEKYLRPTKDSHWLNDPRRIHVA
jgi:hypothetical protein